MGDRRADFRRWLPTGAAGFARWVKGWALALLPEASAQARFLAVHGRGRTEVPGVVVEWYELRPGVDVSIWILGPAGERHFKRLVREIEDRWRKPRYHPRGGPRMEHDAARWLLRVQKYQEIEKLRGDGRTVGQACARAGVTRWWYYGTQARMRALGLL